MNVKLVKIIVFLLVLLGVFTLGLKAQEQDLKWAIKPSYSLLHYKGELNNQMFDFSARNDGLGFAFSRYFNPSVDLIFGFDVTRLKFDGTNDMLAYNSKGFIFSPTASLTYKFANGYLLKDDLKLRPYVGAGIGYHIGQTKGIGYDWHGEEFKHGVDEIEFNLTAGLKYDISMRTSLFIEVTDRFMTTEQWDGAAIDLKNDKYRGARLGVFIKIGQPEDDDKDGVPNTKDRCPDTPEGVPVDRYGCPRDRDKDGIYDPYDDCPDDPGLPEYNGCPDTDGDGIIDKIDDCPQLPGLPEYNGCPDTDGDGVIDPNDLCPGTGPGITVDEYGCPIDSDGDGLTDDVDQCPDEYGPMEYLGCPDPPDVGWPDKQEDTAPEVYFELDKYELSTEAEAELDKIIDYMFSNPNMNIRLFGSADTRGAEDYNKVLSARRVQTVKRYFMRKGIPESRIMIRALGEIQEVQSPGEKPMTQEEIFRKARKVEFETFFFMK